MAHLRASNFLLFYHSQWLPILSLFPILYCPSTILGLPLQPIYLVFPQSTWLFESHFDLSLELLRVIHYDIIILSNLRPGTYLKLCKILEIKNVSFFADSDTLICYQSV